MKKVNIFVPCCMDMYSPEIVYHFVSLLEKVGDEINYIPEQTCCGREFYMEGQTEMAQELLNKMIFEFGTDLRERDPVPIITPTAACAGYIKKYAKELLSNTVEVRLLNLFVQNIFEISDYIVNVKRINTLNNRFNHRVYYYKSCSARNLYQLKNEPEILLSNTEGITLLNTNLTHHCCSGNGRFAVENPPLYDKMIEIIVNDADLQGAQYIVSTDIHCIQHINAYLASTNKNITAIHLVELLNS